MSTTAKGIFTPKHPEKYIGRNLKNIQFRSGWELKMMQFLDLNKYVLQWTSECISIPYRHPLTGKWTMYIPDFMIVYVDKNNKKHCEILEIKPEKEHPLYEGKVSKNTKLVQTVNAAKWQAAMIYCSKRNWFFRVATEKQLFGYERKK